MAQLMPKVAGPRRRPASERGGAGAAVELSRAHRPREERSMKRTTVDLEDNRTALALAGEHDAHLKILEGALDCRLTLRGNVLILEGEDEAGGQGGRRRRRAAQRHPQRAGR